MNALPIPLQTAVLLTASNLFMTQGLSALPKASRDHQNARHQGAKRSRGGSPGEHLQR